MSNVPAWFDDKAYFANKLAQVQASDTASNWTADTFAAALKDAGIDPNSPEALYNHFVQFGNSEGVSPNGYFDADAYIANKAAQSGATVEEVTQAFKDAGLSAWDHYNTFGTKEGINPSDLFDTEAYLQAKVDYEVAKGNNITLDQLKDFLAANNMSALEHYALYGKTEGVVFTPGDYPTYPAIPVDGGYAEMPKGGVSLADFLTKTPAEQATLYIQDDITTLNGAKYTDISSAKGIYVEDTLANLAKADAATWLAKADHVIVADSFGNIAMGTLPDFGTTPVTLFVNTKVPSKVNLGDVTVAKAADAQNVLDAFLARTDVVYDELNGVTKPTSLTVGTYSIKDTAAAVAAADATLLKDAEAVTVADTMAALTANFNAIEAGDNYNVEVLDSLENIANASATIMAGLKTEFSGKLSFAATDEGAAEVTYTKVLADLGSGSTSINIDGVTSLTVNGEAVSATSGATIDVSGMGYINTLFGDKVESINGTNLGDTFSIKIDTANAADIKFDGGAGEDSFSITTGAASGSLTLADHVTNFETINISALVSGDALSLTADDTVKNITSAGSAGATVALDVSNAASLASVTLGSGTETIILGENTNSEINFSGFTAGKSGDKLDVSAFMGEGTTFTLDSGSGASGTTWDSGNVIKVDDWAADKEITGADFGTNLKQDTDYIVITGSGNGAAIYYVNAGVDGVVQDGEIQLIATMASGTSGSAFTADNFTA